MPPNGMVPPVGLHIQAELQAQEFTWSRWGHRLGVVITQANICALLLGKASWAYSCRLQLGGASNCALYCWVIAVWVSFPGEASGCIQQLAGP